MIKYIALFILTAFLDYGWGEYISAVADKKAPKAAFFSAIIYVVGVTVTVFTIENYWAIIPSTLGTMIGTFYSVKKKK